MEPETVETDRQGGRRNPLEGSKSGKRKMPPSVKRLEANRRNAKTAGRKRNPVEYADVERLATSGRVSRHEDGAMNQQQTADALHISPRTLGRRIAEWRRLDAPW
jgi:hypothetical protein